jgi:hypothetical protein
LVSSSGQPPRKTPTKGRASRSRRQARGPAQPPTKAELQAIEARRRATTVLPEDVVVVDDAPSRPTRQATARRTERQRQPAARPTLTKEQEYGYIRSDLRRLVITAGPLLLLMIALLFVLDR